MRLPVDDMSENEEVVVDARRIHPLVPSETIQYRFIVPGNIDVPMWASLVIS